MILRKIGNAIKIGALSITTGLTRISGVTALTTEVGAITAGQRMISAFQCAGISLVTRIRGGSTGSGSVLTEKGKAPMEAYDRFSEHLNSEARELYSKIFKPISKLN